MPKRTDIKKILIIGSGPIVIGQAAEFDYSGTQACKALKQEGYEVILVNSNPATIMTDPEMADKTYIEPLTADILEEIIKKERPDALLPTLGGQTGLNLAVELYENGVLERYGVELIGANYEAIKKGEDRELFKETMESIGLKVPESAVVRSVEEGLKAVEKIGFPVILRPAFTLGGTGSSVAYNVEEFKEKLKVALETSPIHEVLLDKSLIGWKEIEFEVVRDKADNVIIVCAIENFDPMGVHTGDSITVAPTQTLTDKEYQMLRDAAIAVIRAIGVDTGGSNIQFALSPESGDFYVIEMNPRVSRSSALASKATGFPIAKVAAKLAVGYTLDELKNDITKFTPASFEPSIDYVVVKIPRFDFAKFPEADRTLTTMMKSVGEVMAIGRTFKEALLKAVRSLELDRYGLAFPKLTNVDKVELERNLINPNDQRLWYIAEAFRRGYSVDEVYELTKIDRWFLYNIEEIVKFEEVLRKEELTPEILRQAKEMGYSDWEIAKIKGITEEEVRKLRKEEGIVPTFKGVDTCAGEFVAYTPYYYSSYERPYYTVDGQEILDED
ncbi:carbamoyl-phosphate synthase large subunit [Aquifex aeolicus]|uniref:Carbamoyl phosphate synthase large chain, N-terminal section n=1 Tax=Aquifex aeolicus (strain VF5) TaxID=224324 RepID=CARB1_AQUAE|nr:carbamoyl-phosphate synthase large subunit [Aquifex aeolicus]O67869.1 RecName: Full=Carbamoyl phosphate synthase large chain, N-terminal section; AltName: Full=Carbamoyl phosphate synthetase ammonia chain [Aquifex aeolicus VF5]AAC07826.1 carbamoyl-phosphate synthase large subunit [Aquifex aeolicus VF5]